MTELNVPSRGLLIINEPDTYRLIIKSTMPDAERFEKKVMEEILPAIRKTGTYSAAPALCTEEMLLQTAQVLLDHKRALDIVSSSVKAIDARVGKIADQMERQTTMPEFFTVLGFARIEYNTSIPIDVANKIGRKAATRSRGLGVPIGKAYDARFGQINTYRHDILQNLFREYETEPVA